MGPMKLKSKSAWLLHFAAALLIVWPWQLDNSTAPQFPVRERSPDRSRRVTGAWECVAAPEHFVVSCAGIGGSFRTVGWPRARLPGTHVCPESQNDVRLVAPNDLEFADRSGDDIIVSPEPFPLL